MRLHSLSPFERQKKPARRNDDMTLDTDSQKCDSQGCKTTEKGFRDGDVRGPFSFAVLISVPILRTSGRPRRGRPTDWQ
jgi:hypothetical protein